MGETISISSQLPTQICGCKERVVRGVGVYVRLCYRQRLPVLFLLFFYQQAGKWALIFPLEAFSELILPLYHLHHPQAIVI